MKLVQTRPILTSLILILFLISITPSFSSNSMNVFNRSTGYSAQSTSTSSELPEPAITDINYPQFIELGQSATIGITATNNGGTAGYQTINTSFPTNLSSNSVSVVSTDISYHYVLSPGLSWYACYGKCNVTLQYPLAEGVVQQNGWTHGVSHYLEVSVTPPAAGMFTFYVKSVASPANNSLACCWDPQGGIVDQQNEYVYAKTIDVLAPGAIGVSISPNSSSIGYGSSAQLTATATGGTSIYSDYKWYWSELGTQNSGTIDSGSDSSIDFSPSNSGIYYVHAQVTDSAGDVGTSSVAQVKVGQRPPSPFGNLSVLVVTNSSSVALNGDSSPKMASTPVSGAEVQMLSAPSGQSLLSGTTSNGAFIFSGIQPGYYTLQVTGQGFKTDKSQNILLGDSQTEQSTFWLSNSLSSTSTISFTMNNLPAGAEWSVSLQCYSTQETCYSTNIPFGPSTSSGTMSFTVEGGNTYSYVAKFFVPESPNGEVESCAYIATNGLCVTDLSCELPPTQSGTFYLARGASKSFQFYSLNDCKVNSAAIAQNAQSIDSTDELLHQICETYNSCMDSISAIQDESVSTLNTINSHTTISGASAILKPTSMHVGNFPTGIAFDGATNQIFVSDWGSNDVTVYTASTLSLVANISVGMMPTGMAYDSINGYVYVSNWGSGTVSVIDPTTDKVLTNITVGNFPSSIVFDPKSNSIFVANWGSNYVSAISPVTDSAVEVNLSSSPFELAVDSKTGDVYATEAGSSTVAIISGSAYVVLKNLTLNIVPLAISFDHVNSMLYVSSQSSGNLSEIDPQTGLTVANISVGCQSIAIAMRDKASEAYVIGWSNSVASIVNLTSDSVISTVGVGRFPFGLAIDSSNGAAFVASWGSGTVSVIPKRVVSHLNLVTFSENGLGWNDSWGISLEGNLIFTTSNNISLLAPNGYYNFTVLQSPYGARPENGTIHVKNSDLIKVIKFSDVPHTKYRIKFSEKGLPIGSNWSIILSGASIQSNQTSISFRVLNGSYLFTVQSPSGYASSINSGSVLMAGNDIRVILKFRPAV